MDAAGVDPLALDSFAAVPRVLRGLCRRACGFARDPVADTAALVARVAREPLRGFVVRRDGLRQPASLTRQELFLILQHEDPLELSRSEFPGAVVSALRGDTAPLLRLKRRALAAAGYRSPRYESAATNAATLCATAERCARRRAFFRPEPPLPETLRDIAPAGGVPGRRGRLMGAIAASFGDLFDDLFASIYSDPELMQIEAESERLRFRGAGLRGGNSVVGENLFRLNSYEFVPGVRLSGNWLSERSERPLRVDGPGRLDGRLRFAELADGTTMRIHGRIAGRRVRARVPIPSRVLVAFSEVEVDLGGSARAALRWPSCARQPSPSSSPPVWPLRLLPKPRCASSAAGRTASAARG